MFVLLGRDNSAPIKRDCGIDTGPVPRSGGPDAGCVRVPTAPEGLLLWPGPDVEPPVAARPGRVLRPGHPGMGDRDQLETMRSCTRTTSRFLCYSLAFDRWFRHRPECVNGVAI